MSAQKQGVGGQPYVAPGFEAVRHAFERNFSAGLELGASFAVVRDGELVVDLWGGIADSPHDRPWRADTLQFIFSGSKGLVAICLLILIDRDLLDPEARVCEYWPEFAAAGKQAVTVAELASHAARLPGLAEPVDVAETTDDRRMAELLAAQPQFEDPRAAQVYHPLTFGWLCGELIRRVDSRSVGRFFAEEIAGPLDVDVFIGLPAELEPRVSRLEVADGSGEDSAFYPGTDEIDPLRQAVWGNTANGDLNVFPWNSPAFHQAEMPAVNAIGTARGIASIYGALDELVSPAVIKLGTRELQSRFDPLHEEQQRFGLGFELQTESLPLGPPVDGFGHGGAGGSVHGRWPSQKVGFSYAMNLMRSDGPPGDPRPRALLDALYGCL